MEAPDPAAAQRLERAKTDLTNSIERLIEEHLSKSGKRATLDLSFDEGVDTVVEDTEHDASVVEGTKALVASFHDDPDVRTVGRARQARNGHRLGRRRRRGRQRALRLPALTLSGLSCCPSVSLVVDGRFYLAHRSTNHFRTD